MVIASVCPVYLYGLLNGWRGFPFPCAPESAHIPSACNFFNVFRVVGGRLSNPPSTFEQLGCSAGFVGLSVPGLNDFNLYLHVCNCSVCAWMLNLWGKKSCLPSSFQSSDCCCFYETELILAVPKMSSVWIKDSLSLINVAEISWEPRMDDALSSTKKSPGNLTTNKQYKIVCNSGKEMRSSARN